MFVSALDELAFGISSSGHSLTHTQDSVLKPSVDLTLALHFTHWCVCDTGEVSTGFHVRRDLFRSLWTERLPANTHLNNEVWPQIHTPPLRHLCESSVLFLSHEVIWQEGLSEGYLASFPCPPLWTALVRWEWWCEAAPCPEEQELKLARLAFELCYWDLLSEFNRVAS